MLVFCMRRVARKFVHRRLNSDLGSGREGLDGRRPEHGVSVARERRRLVDRVVRLAQVQTQQHPLEPAIKDGGTRSKLDASHQTADCYVLSKDYKTICVSTEVDGEA